MERGTKILLVPAWKLEVCFTVKMPLLMLKRVLHLITIVLYMGHAISQKCTYRNQNYVGKSISKLQMDIELKQTRVLI
jgi:hypothetical protein